MVPYLLVSIHITFHKEDFITCNTMFMLDQIDMIQNIEYFNLFSVVAAKVCGCILQSA